MGDDYEAYAQNLDSMISEQRAHLSSGCTDIPTCLGPAAMRSLNAAIRTDRRYLVKVLLVAVTELRQARDEIEAQTGMLRDAALTMDGLADESREKEAQIAALTEVVGELKRQLTAYEEARES